MVKKRHIVKQVIAIILIVFLFTLIAINLIGRIDFTKYSETFIGKLSENEYPTAEIAVREYLNTELNGLVSTTSLSNYVSLGKVDESEEAMFKLDDSVTDMEKTQITYECDGEKYTIVMYVCQLQDDVYKYYVPEAEIGMPLTKSYFESVMDPAKYTNYTMNRTETCGVGLFGINIKMDVKDSIKVADNVAYLGQWGDSASSKVSTEAYFWDTSEGLQAFTKQTLEMDVEGIMKFIKFLDSFLHFVEDENFWEDIDHGKEVIFPYNNETYCYENGMLLLKDDWHSTYSKDLIGEISYIMDLASIGFPGEIDHTYFVKTKNGFAVNPLKKKQFTEQMVKSAAQVQDLSVDEMEKFLEIVDWDFDGSYYVSEGRLAKSVLKRAGTFKAEEIKELLEGSTSEGVIKIFENLSMAASEEVRFTNFGTTSITVPEQIYQYFN